MMLSLAACGSNGGSAANSGSTQSSASQTGDGDSPTCSTIINGFVSSNVDLILANATAPLQAAAAGTDSIPVIGTSVTDYATALDIDQWTGSTGRNISGTCDLAPLDQQAAMIQELFPDAKTVGMLYCSGEPNSVYQIEQMEGYLTEMGYTCERFSFTDSNDVAAATAVKMYNESVCQQLGLTMPEDYSPIAAD